MEKDKFKTPVKFYKEITDEEGTEQVFTFFPEMYYNKELYETTFTMYAHIGQHGACHIDYIEKCRPATKEEYSNLFNELESLGYNLQIV